MTPSARPLRCASLALGSLIASALLLCACDEPGVGRGPSHPPRAVPSADPSSTATSAGCSDADLRMPAKRVIRGKSTYYADSLAGNLTANGERYDPARLTAAHRTLPFGTRLRVTRTDLHPSPVLCVVVNDRGPFGNRRYVLDLSRRGAEHLRMIRAGVVPVQIDVL